jgi:hypothetical protein
MGQDVVEGVAEADQLIDLLLQRLHISPQPIHCLSGEQTILQLAAEVE